MHLPTASATLQAIEQETQFVECRPQLVAAQVPLRLVEVIRGQTEVAAGERQRLDQRSQSVKLIARKVFSAHRLHQRRQPRGCAVARFVVSSSLAGLCVGKKGFHGLSPDFEDYRTLPK
jgi:hypothetical protein